MPKNKPSMQLNLPFWQSIVLFLTASVIALPANAQVDAGALQQNLEQQLPLPSPLALPQPGKPEPLQQTAPKDGETRFVVKSFVVEGINILPEVQIQEVLRPWVSRSVNFDDLQRPVMQSSITIGKMAIPCKRYCHPKRLPMASSRF